MWKVRELGYMLLNHVIVQFIQFVYLFHQTLEPSNLFIRKADLPPVL